MLALQVDVEGAPYDLSHRYAFGFSEGVRSALSSARDEALRLGHDYLGVERILLGILSDPENSAGAILGRLREEPESVRPVVEASLSPGGAELHLGELPYAESGKGTLEASMREARDLGIHEITTALLLLGILVQDSPVTGMPDSVSPSAVRAILAAKDG